MDAQEILYKEGVALDMCQKYRDEWGTPDTAKLCRMFFEGQDFCIEHDWPKVETLKELFDINELARYGVYVGDGDAMSQLHVAVLGDSDVHVFVPERHICDIYARHDSNVSIHLGVGAFAYVSMHDNCTVTVCEKREGATLKCSHFGGTIVRKELFNTIHEKTNKED